MTGFIHPKCTGTTEFTQESHITSPSLSCFESFWFVNFYHKKKHPTTYVLLSPFSLAWASQQRVAVLLFLGFWWVFGELLDWSCIHPSRSIPEKPLQRHRHQTSSVQALLPMINPRMSWSSSGKIPLITPEDYTRFFLVFLRNYCLSRLKPKSFLKQI